MPCGNGLLGALAYFGLEGLAAAEKEDMRQLAQRPGPHYGCRTPGAAHLLSDRRGRAGPVAPRDAALTSTYPARSCEGAICRRRPGWNGRGPLRCGNPQRAARAVGRRSVTGLARDVNRTCAVFVPTGITLDPASRVGAAILRTAAARGLDPYHLAGRSRPRLARTPPALPGHPHGQARRRAPGPDSPRRASPAGSSAGHDASSWPGLDEMATTLVDELPALGLGARASAGWRDAAPQYGDRSGSCSATRTTAYPSVMTRRSSAAPLTS